MTKGQELALPLVGGAINARTVSDACTPLIQKMLDESTDAQDFARRVARVPKALDDLRERGSVIARLAAPLDETEVFRALGPLVILYGSPDFGDSEDGDRMEKVWKAVYAKALRNVPREALAYAVDLFIEKGHPTKPRESGKFPTPDVLIALAKKKTEEIHATAYRVKVALAANGADKPPEKTPEQIAEVRAFLASLKAGKSLQEATSYPRPKESQHAMADRMRANL